MLYDNQNNEQGSSVKMDTRLATVADATAANGDLAEELLRRGSNAANPVLKEALFYLAGLLPAERVSGAAFAELLERTAWSTSSYRSELQEVAVGAFHEARVFGPDRLLH